MLVVKPIAKMSRLSLVHIHQADLPGIEGLSGGGPQGPAFGANGVPLRAQASAVASAGCMAR